MKKRSLLLFLLYISILSVILYGCGGGAGAPGSKGTEDTGVIVDATVVGSYLDNYTGSVDAFQAICKEGPPPEYEFIADHQAEVTFIASLINPFPTITPGKIYIDHYTIEYRRSNDSLGAPPIEMDTRYVTMPIYPPTSGLGFTNYTYSIMLVDLVRKEKYYDDITSGRYDYHIGYINNYTAIFTFYGTNDYGEKTTIKAEMDFQIGAFDNCS